MNVLIGGLSSAVGLAISEVARQEKVVYIATIPKTIQMTTTKLHDHVFRTASHTDFEGDAMAQSWPSSASRSSATSSSTTPTATTSGRASCAASRATRRTRSS